MTRKPNQTNNFKACTGNVVPLIQSFDTGIDVEAKQERNIFCQFNLIQRKSESEIASNIESSSEGMR